MLARGEALRITQMNYFFNIRVEKLQVKTTYSPKCPERLSEKVFGRRSKREFGRQAEHEIGQKGNFLGSRRATPRAPQRLFGQSQKVNSAKLARGLLEWHHGHIKWEGHYLPRGR